jgi:two-component sensor histidine kinase
MHKTYLIIIIACIGFANIMFAQNPYAIELYKSNGLPSNKVYDIKQDSKGFIWIASDEGLSRFNGTTFHTLKSFKQSSTPGSCIIEDKYGRIWYENFDGYLYYVENDSLKSLTQNKPVQYIPFGISNEFIYTIQENGIDIFNLKSLILEKTIVINVTNIEHACMFNDSYYIFINDTLFKINKDFSITKSYSFIDNNELVKQIYADRHNLYVVSKLNENKKLYCIDENLNIIKTIKIPEVEFIQSSCIIDDNYWINSTNGVYVYSKNGKLLHHYLENISISSALKDYQQNYWLGSTNDGLKIISDLRNQIYTTKEFVPTKIIEFKNQFLIATKNGDLYISNTAFNNFKNIFKPAEKSEIHYLQYDSIENKIYLASKGFTVINGNTYKVVQIENFAIKSLLRIDSSYIAFSASGMSGLIKTASIKSDFDSLFANSINSYNDLYKGFFNNNRGKTIAYNNETKSIYYGTNVGLYKVNLSGIKEIKGNGESFYASKLYYYNNTLFALSTKGNFFAIKNDSTFEILNAKVGLREFEIRNFKFINNKFYVLNNKSIHEFDFVNNASRKITPASTSFDIYDFTVSNNQLIILTNNGILTFKIDDAKIKTDPKFYIHTLHTGDKQITDLKSDLELEHFQNNISIFFSVLDYGEKSYSKLYYQINNGDLIELPENSNRLDLPLLAAGNYLIDFFLDDKKLSPSIQFKILQPVWKRWWFIALVAFVVLLVIYIYYKYQVGLLRKQVKLLNEKVELEHNLHKSIMKTIKSQMNPHFFYNALNTIQAFIFTNDKAKANTYLAKFSKLTRLILEQSEKDTITLADEINTLQLYLELEKMRFNNDFEYTINADSICNKEIIEIPPMLIQPYVENALKHGLLHKEQDKKLQIVFETVNKVLYVTIDDNGIGRKKAEEIKKIRDEKFTSFSSQANEKRLEIINQTVGNKMGVEIIDKYNNEKTATGTKVILTIPIH